MPREVSERARALLSGEWTPPPLRDASTVVLLREGAGLETFLMRRVETMAFAAGMHVFPGGRIDEADLTANIDVTGAPVDATRMTAGEDLGRGLLVCAARELFEETGVLLAVDPSGRSPAEDANWEDDRLAVQTDSAAFADVLSRRSLVLAPALMPVWSHWVTPEVESRRYDVRFFVAAVPPGQRARDLSGEADRVLWSPPQDALRDYAAGTLPMLPPTAATLSELAEFATVEAAMAAAPSRQVRPLLPRPRSLPDGGIGWDLVDARDGSVVVALPSEPAGSEAAGVHGGTG